MKRVKVGLSSMFLGDASIEEVLGIAARHDIEVLDAWYDMPCHVLEEDAGRGRVEAAIIDARQRTGLVAVAHLASFDVNPVAYNPAMQRACLEETIKSLRFASRIGARAVTLHGGENAFDGTFTRYDTMLLERLIRSLLDLVSEEGIDITICIENDAPTTRMSRPLECIGIVETMLDRYPALGLTVDIAHAAKATRDAGSFQVRGNRLDIDAVDGILARFGSRTRIVHFSWPGNHHTHERLDRNDPALTSIVNSLGTRPLHPDVVGIVEYEASQFEGWDKAAGAMVDDAAWLRGILTRGDEA